MGKNKILNFFMFLLIITFFLGGKIINNIYAQEDLSKSLLNNNSNSGSISAGEVNSEPLKNFWNMLKKINFFSPGDVNVSLDSVKNSDLLNNLSEPNFLISWLEDLWNKTNDWFFLHIGVSLREIIKVVVNIVIWIWGLIIKLLEDLLSKI